MNLTNMLSLLRPQSKVGATIGRGILNFAKQHRLISNSQITPNSFVHTRRCASIPPSIISPSSNIINANLDGPKACLAAIPQFSFFTKPRYYASTAAQQKLADAGEDATITVATEVVKKTKKDATTKNKSKSRVLRPTKKAITKKKAPNEPTATLDDEDKEVRALKTLERTVQIFHKKRLMEEGKLSEEELQAHAVLRAFSALKLEGPICRAALAMGFKMPTEIQRQVIPEALANHNIIASAETGTGKTAAYGFPLLQKLRKHLLDEQRVATISNVRRKAPLVLILCPTKELAEQVGRHIQTYAQHAEEKIRIVVITGAANRERQIEEIKQGADIVIATPGRILDILRKESSVLDLSQVKHFVIDECDKMLNMGFIPDIQDIYALLPRPQKVNGVKVRMQVMMFTATLVPNVTGLMQRFASQHKLINLNADMSVADPIKHVKYMVTNRRKYALLTYLLKRKTMKGKSALIFVRTKQRADRLAAKLVEDKFNAVALHKDKTPASREKAIESFRKGEIQLLVATDVLARGIDVENLPFVINYDIPAIPEDYVHRVGRTGRAGKEGMAISLVGRVPQVIKVGNRPVELNEEHFIKAIESFLKQRVEERKVPGPWKDVDKRTLAAIKQGEKVEELDRNEADEEKKRALEASRRLALQLLKKKREQERRRLEHLKANKRKKVNQRQIKEMELKFSKTYDKLARRSFLRGVDPLENPDTPTLRHFADGRYEQVVRMFDEKRALKRGVKPLTRRERKKKNKKSTSTKESD